MASWLLWIYYKSLKTLVWFHRLGHYTIPEEMDEVCAWITSKLGLEGHSSWSQAKILEEKNKNGEGKNWNNWVLLQKVLRERERRGGGGGVYMV